MHPLPLARFHRVIGRIGSLRIAGDGASRSQLRVVIGPVPVAAPLPYISGEVIKAITVGRELGDRCEAGKAVFTRVFHRKSPLKSVRHDLAARPKFVTPHVKFSSDATARCKFPLRLGRQALARPLGVGDCVIAGDVYSGVFFPPVQTTVGPFGMTPVGASLIAPPLIMIVQRDRARSWREDD